MTLISAVHLMRVMYSNKWFVDVCACTIMGVHKNSQDHNNYVHINCSKAKYTCVLIWQTKQSLLVYAIIVCAG